MIPLFGVAQAAKRTKKAIFLARKIVFIARKINLIARKMHFHDREGF